MEPAGGGADLFIVSSLKAITASKGRKQKGRMRGGLGFNKASHRRDARFDGAGILGEARGENGNVVLLSGCMRRYKKSDEVNTRRVHLANVTIEINWSHVI